MSRLFILLVCTGFLCGGVRAMADEAATTPAASAPATPAPPAISKHQMMKDCMAKQKASESGMSAEDMRKNCRDLTKTEKQNQDRGTAPVNGDTPAT